MRHSVKVLQECIDLQNKKANDYQNSSSRVKQAEYYPNGCLTIHDIMHAKMLRMKSVMDAMQNDPNYVPNYESLEDSAKDLINYASFFVSWLRHNIDGQDPLSDFINRKLPNTNWSAPKPIETANIGGQGFVYLNTNDTMNTTVPCGGYTFENGETYVEPEGC